MLSVLINKYRAKAFARNTPGPDQTHTTDRNNTMYQTQIHMIDRSQIGQ